MRRKTLTRLTICAVSLLAAGCFRMYRPPHARVERDLTRIVSLRVYDLKELHRQQYSDEELARAASAEFDPEVLRELLPRVKYSRHQGPYKGGCLAVARFADGGELRLRLSYFAAFFEVLDERGCYSFEAPEDKQKWED